MSTRIYYASIYIFYGLFTSRHVQEFKNYQNTSSTSKVINKTGLNFWKNYILFCIAFDFEVETRLSGESVTQCIRESRMHMNHVRT